MRKVVGKLSFVSDLIKSVWIIHATVQWDKNSAWDEAEDDESIFAIAMMAININYLLKFHAFENYSSEKKINYA